MAEIRFYGASDDLLEIDGAIEEEFSNPSGRIVVQVAGPEYGSLLVVAEYGKHGNGNWVLGVTADGDDVPLPNWPITIRTADPNRECSYSPTLIVEAPEGSEVREMTDV